MRLQKYIAQCGVCSRRSAENLISGGRVEVNGETVTQLGTTIDENRDIVAVDGKRLSPPRNKRYYMLYKPRGVVCTCADEKGRKTVCDILLPEGGRLYPVGRLDYDSEGLVIMTDDGEYANSVIHPSNKVEKRYRVTLDGKYSQELASALIKGVDIGDRKTAKAENVKYENRNDGRAILEISITEGRNHQIKRMLMAQGLETLLLKRVQIGSLKLEKLLPGQFRALTKEQAKLALVQCDNKNQ